MTRRTNSAWACLMDLRGDRLRSRLPISHPTSHVRRFRSNNTNNLSTRRTLTPFAQRLRERTLLPVQAAQDHPLSPNGARLEKLISMEHQNGKRLCSVWLLSNGHLWWISAELRHEHRKDR